MSRTIIHTRRSSRRARVKKLLQSVFIFLSLCFILLVLFIFNAFLSPGEKNQVQETLSEPQDSASGENIPVSSGNLTSAAPLLVNKWNFITDGYQVNLTQLNNGQAIATLCYPELQQMMDDLRNAGLSPLICSSYRTSEKQKQLFEAQVKQVIAEGYSRDDAEAEAARTVARPGTSEHQLGLAADIVDENHQLLDDSQENTAVQKWLMNNSWKYGFVLRYPTGKSDITGVIYEPWHYRYVGKDTAKKMYEKDLCLEEFINAK